VRTMIIDEVKLREEAKEHILKTRRALREFPHYPKSWLNKLICFRYNVNDPIEKQIRDYCNFEKKSPAKRKKFDIIVVQ